ncbi:MAG: squalene/phytoene synthase family protein, partial [Stellaceae bacterium]
MAERALSEIETPSGKAAGDENFPVGSFLIRRELRPHVHAFYRFARQADDIADNSNLADEDKIRRLDRMGEILDGAPGEESPAAVAMRQSLL